MRKNEVDWNAVQSGAVTGKRFLLLQKIGQLDKLPGGWCWASQAQLGEWIGLSRQAVSGGCTVLAALGLIAKRTFRTFGARLKCSYRLTDAGRAVLRRGIACIFGKNPLQSTVSGGVTERRANAFKPRLFVNGAANAAHQLQLWITSKAKSAFRERAAPPATPDQLAWEARTRAEFIDRARLRGMAV